MVPVAARGGIARVVGKAPPAAAAVAALLALPIQAHAVQKLGIAALLPSA
eukprot:COSAG06_NODE_61500_length_267_cov_1.089286_1_plen_49_part_10